MRSGLLLLTASAALVLPAPAGADARHTIVSQAPIKQRGKVVGYRATLLLEPEGLTKDHPTLGGDVRVGLGRMKFVDRNLGPNDVGNRHREANAGAQPGYLHHQFQMREITGPNETDRGPHAETLKTGGQPKEVEIEVLYKDNPALIPGMKADLVAGFYKGTYWHIWGAAHGPMHSSQDFVVELPGKANTRSYQRAIEFLKAEQTRLTAEAQQVAPQLPAAEAAVAAAQQQYQRTYSSTNQLEVTKALAALSLLKAPGAKAQIAGERIAELEQELAAFVAAKAAAKSGGAAETAQTAQ